MRLIDADALKAAIKTYIQNSAFWAPVYKLLAKVIDGAPTVDAVPVVRCKDCKHSHPIIETDKSVWCLKRGMPRKNEWFCADGEREEDVYAAD